MEPAHPAVAGKGSRRREVVLALLLAVAAVLSALLFEVAVHPERIHDPRHGARFAADREALPALGAGRVRFDGPLPAVAEFGRIAGITPGVTGPFSRARYLRATPAEVAEAVLALDRGEAPVPPPVPDLSRYYRDARGPYRCDLLLAPGKTPADVRAKLPSALLSGEPVAREAEDGERKAVARALLLGLAVMAAWNAWRKGLREAQQRLLAALGALLVTGLLGAGIDRWSVAALLLVAGAPGGAPLLAAAPCLLFPSLALERLGLILCLGGGLRLLMRRPVLPPRPGRQRVARAAALAVALGVAGFLLLHAAPLRVVPRPEVAAEPGALFVAPADIGEVARGLRGQGLLVIGDEPLLPATPEPAMRRGIWKIFTRARTLAARAEGEERARFEDVGAAAAGFSLTTLPSELRLRLKTRDGRSVLWAPADADLPELTSARLYRARGEAQLRSEARLAGVLVAFAWALAVAVLQGRLPLLRLLAAFVAAALLFVADPAEGDFWLPLLPLAAAAPAVGPALALAAASVFLPILLWPAVALALAAALITCGSTRKGPSRS